MAHGPRLPFRWRDLLGIFVCMAAARSAAMAFNRLADRRLDALNPRTRTRHLPSGVLSVAAVAAFTAVCGGGLRGRARSCFFPTVATLCLAAGAAVRVWL